ncbi:MAG: radical SAM/SPASM domain-containing protein [Candidatus Helarchaeota archaeon]
MSAKIQAVLFEITKNCNLNCKHCYTVSPQEKEDFVNEDLSLDQIKYILEKIKPYNIKTLNLTGGEPFLRSDLFEIIDFATDCGFESIVINTNGTLFFNDPNLVKQVEMRLNIISAVVVSFDGATAKTHDFIRGKGEFNNLMRNLEVVKNSNLPLGINVTLGKWNIHEFFEFIRLYEKYKAFFMNFGVFLPIGNGIKLKDQLLTKNEIKKIINAVVTKKLASYNVDLCSVPYSRITDSNISGYCCNVFTDFITITSKGLVIPCIIYDLNCGSLLDPKIELNEILMHPIAQIFRDNSKLRDRMKGSCKICSNFEICKGGCHLLTYALKNDVFESDDLCPISNIF